jgi:hypothetical protein
MVNLLLISKQFNGYINNLLGFKPVKHAPVLVFSLRYACNYYYIERGVQKLVRNFCTYVLACCGFKGVLGTSITSICILISAVHFYITFGLQFYGRGIPCKSPLYTPEAIKGLFLM